jgi:SAM-dependent methyltransferase
MHPYDEHAEFYLDFVDRGLASEDGYVSLLFSTLLGCLGERLEDAHVCDLCCGEGYLGRRLVRCGASDVVGVDLSSRLVDVARRRADSPRLSYRVDDARRLQSLRDGEFDVVASQMAMMDVADHKSLFASVRRVLKSGGAFVFSLLHPCFMAPCHAVDAPPVTLDDAGKPVALAVRRYATEGHWNSGGDGVRGRMGAYHRKVSTYVNDLLASGFALERLEEPLAGDDATEFGLFAEVPTALVIAAHAI